MTTALSPLEAVLGLDFATMFEDLAFLSNVTETTTGKRYKAQITVPNGFDATAATVKLKDNVLTVKVPRIVEATTTDNDGTLLEITKE